ncbi:hypothetical protein [Bacteriovorax sp. Seq25_V]|uniref:hypothetical protein n=1 Tax=Bacteriovorax sp. Seq25_V TaxID=1201288 RepID=UPI000389E866|nr:hypothetical protein [Bacteriovorax sp. Seq25_V]EQC45691.1 hypothetical protein M900_2262 [Bacteriovorax sp. Seq25_V]
MKLLTFTLLLTNLSVFAAPVMKVECKTARENFIVKIKDNNLTIDGRYPAQTMAQRTRDLGKGVEKIFYLSGEKHTIHIGDKNKFSELNDFIAIKSRKGHEVTFPLNCQNL